MYRLLVRGRDHLWNLKAGENGIQKFLKRDAM